MSAWLLRPNLEKMFGPSHVKVVILEVDAQGKETEIERLSLVRESVLKELVQNQISKGRRRLILDLSTVAKVDAAGVGEIASASLLATKSRAELVLANMRPQPREAFRISGIDSVSRQQKSDTLGVRSLVTQLRQGGQLRHPTGGVRKAKCGDEDILGTPVRSMPPLSQIDALRQQY